MRSKSKHSVSLQIRITLTVRLGNRFWAFCRWLLSCLF